MSAMDPKPEPPTLGQVIAAVVWALAGLLAVALLLYGLCWIVGAGVGAGLCFAGAC